MLTLSSVAILFPKSPCSVADDANNNSSPTLSCGALALKVLAAPAPAPATASRRCLFGAPSPADTQRLLRDDLEAAKARMARRWGWDLAKGRPADVHTNWKWETVKIPATTSTPTCAGPRVPRHHPYSARRVAANTPNVSPFTVPAMVFPLPATPTQPQLDLDTTASPASTSSSSGTSTLAASPSTPKSDASSSPSTPTLEERTPSSWSSDDSCCGGSETESDEEVSPFLIASIARLSESPSTAASVVQTKLTDFWRTRRCSTSDGFASNKASASASPSKGVQALHALQAHHVALLSPTRSRLATC